MGIVSRGGRLMTDYEEDILWQEELNREHIEWLKEFHYRQMMDELREQEEAMYPLFYWQKDII